MKLKYFLFLIPAYIFIIFKAFTVPAIDGDFRRNSFSGDAYSDVNTLSAIRYYHDYGFLKSCGLPVHGYSSIGDTIYKVYTHYPALPDILGGLYSIILDNDFEPWLRMGPILLSIFWCWIMGLVLIRLLPNKEWLLPAWLLIIYSGYFIPWADTLHKHMYEEALKWLYVLILLNYFQNGENWKWLLAAMLVFIAEINISFEPVTWMAVFTLGCSLYYQRTIFSRLAIACGFSAILGFFLHLLQNYFWFGSWDLVIQDLQQAFLMRTIGENAEIADKVLSTMDYIKMPFDIINRLERLYWIPGFALLLLLWDGVKLFSKEGKSLLIVLALSSISWFLAMPQHGLVHAFTGRHFGILIGVLIVPAIVGAISRFKSSPYFIKIVYGLLAIYILSLGVRWQLITRYFEIM
jgi:hypothetical protein